MFELLLVCLHYYFFVCLFVCLFVCICEFGCNTFVWVVAFVWLYYSLFGHILVCLVAVVGNRLLAFIVCRHLFVCLFVCLTVCVNYYLFASVC